MTIDSNFCYFIVNCIQKRKYLFCLNDQESVVEEVTFTLGPGAWISFGEVAMGRGHSVHHKPRQEWESSEQV